MPVDVGARFEPLVERRAAREPVAFITGQREFWGLDFEVSPDVLIPRPETELIVEAVCDRRRRDASGRLSTSAPAADVIAVALAREFLRATVVATDISDAALAVAHRNVARHQVDDRVSSSAAICSTQCSGPVDVIVSNPPYVSPAVELSPEIVNFEPAVALFAGPMG